MEFPALPHLQFSGVDVDFRYARGLDMYQHIRDGSWTYEPEVLALVLCLLGRERRSRFIDVGANIGYFPVIASTLLGSRVDVHVYEPMPRLVRSLRRARRQNRISFHVHNSALSDFVGSAAFHLSARSDMSNSLNPDFRPSKRSVDVDVSTLDAEFPKIRSQRFRADECDSDAPTVLLIDTESTEPAVLRGGIGFIERVRPAIICEVLAGRTEGELAEIIERIDYRPYALTGDGLERRRDVVGDRTYRHRDWLFLHRESSAPSPECLADTMAILTGCGGQA